MMDASTLNDFRAQLIREERGRILNQADLTDAEVLYGQCTNFCERFRQKFPELRVVKGWCSGREHWWLVKPDGEIYDPTVEQFLILKPNKPVYRELDPEKDKVRIGKCMNCGNEIYGLIKEGHKSICSEECKQSFIEYMEGETKKPTYEK